MEEEQSFFKSYFFFLQLGGMHPTSCFSTIWRKVRGKNTPPNQHTKMGKSRMSSSNSKINQSKGSFPRQSPAYSITSPAPLSKEPTSRVIRAKLLTRKRSFHAKIWHFKTSKQLKLPKKSLHYQSRGRNNSMGNYRVNEPQHMSEKSAHFSLRWERKRQGHTGIANMSFKCRGSKVLPSSILCLWQTLQTDVVSGHGLRVSPNMPPLAVDPSRHSRRNLFAVSSLVKWIFIYFSKIF